MTFIKLALKDIIKFTKGSRNNIFQDSFNKILYQQLTHDRSYISVIHLPRKSLHNYGSINTIQLCYFEKRNIDH